MEWIKKTPLYVPALGMVASYVLIIVAVLMSSMPILLAGLIVLHIFVWLLGAKFFLLAASSFSVVLDPQS